MCWCWDGPIDVGLFPIDLQPDTRVKKVDDIVVLVANLCHLFGCPLAETDAVTVALPAEMKTVWYSYHIKQQALNSSITRQFSKVISQHFDRTISNKNQLKGAFRGSLFVDKNLFNRTEFVPAPT